MTTETTNIDVTESRPTDLPEFASILPPIQADRDYIIEDGLAMRTEIARYRGKPADSFTELDDFFKSSE